MTGAEIICAVAKEVPGDALTQLSVGVAILVARDNWTGADTQKYGEKYRDIIFKWAEELAEIHSSARRPRDENEVCQYCKRPLREHTLDQIQECGIKELGHVLLDLICDCGKKLREHTQGEVHACAPLRRNLQ